MFHPELREGDILEDEYSEDRLYLTHTDGCHRCHSFIGRKGTGVQVLSLGKGCDSHGTILHELGHAVGFAHEHNRSDRDDYLNIFWENINPRADKRGSYRVWKGAIKKGAAGYKDQFLKLKPYENRLLTTFDYNSVMLYAEDTFSVDWRKTMVAKDPPSDLSMSPRNRGSARWTSSASTSSTSAKNKTLL
ncbi:hypothetical protein LAZ67_4001619 [Cordylochernes scorpioides]|uniref:Metalloendopeptidase n=1 Tax=Cordylochernes scorpioides TaxID=51811 RepID=A0ABY6KCB1_9ARAC|nr:hypothetical protein LAZ67_4001619 [Cordylochernes scorpioides]